MLMILDYRTSFNGTPRQSICYRRTSLEGSNECTAKANCRLAQIGCLNHRRTKKKDIATRINNVIYTLPIIFDFDFHFVPKFTSMYGNNLS